MIGIGAGAAAALLFASVASGSSLSILLFYLAPLPILIAALGWSHWAALIAALAGALALALVFGPVFFFAFLVGVGLPAWWLGYLALLARPAGNGGRRRSNGIRPAGWWSGPRSSPRWSWSSPSPISALDAESFRAGLRSALDAHAARRDRRAGGCSARDARRVQCRAG